MAGKKGQSGPPGQCECIFNMGWPLPGAGERRFSLCVKDNRPHKGFGHRVGII